MTEPRVWKVNLDQPDDPRWWAVLSTSERERAARFADPDQRRRYAVAHTALRAILGHECELPAAQLRFRIEAGGRPFLEMPGGPAPPDFNLSHSGEWALVAVGPPHWRVGVDVEQIRPDLDFLAMARHMYQAVEVERLLMADPPLQRTEYFQLWSAKEAYVKALGLGLAGFRDVLVLREHNAVRGTVLSRSAPDTVWPVRWLDVAPGYVAAIVNGPPPSTAIAA